MKHSLYESLYSTALAMQGDVISIVYINNPRHFIFRSENENLLKYF